ncbi:MAG: hypothetical protein MZV70_37265 [Desulfobacterales bacterium]|nr:hypothetical protein [Desulfobacterales bacterium]
MGYIITEGTLIGENNGIVTRVAKDGVTIKQHFKDYMGRVNYPRSCIGAQEGRGGKVA